MKIRTLTTAVVMALGMLAACVASADAAILVATYTGTVSTGWDQTGLFGAPGGDLTGDAYIATYTIDTTRGFYETGVPTFDELNGGSYYGVSAPVSATLEINGITQSVAGNYLSVDFDTQYYNGTADEVQDRSSGAIYSDIYVWNSQYGITNSTVYGVLPLTTTWNLGGGTWSTSDPNTFQPLTVTYADFDGPGTLQISAGAAPEPATWAMMLLGVFGIGGALRMARREGLRAA